MNKSKKIVLQIIFVGIIFSVIAILANNLIVNLIRTNVGIDFKWLLETSGFELAEKSLPYKTSDSYSWALLVGWVNSLKVILFSLVLSTILGFTAGLASTNRNLLLRILSRTYVAIIRQIPLLIQLLFWYFVVFLGILKQPIRILNSISLSNNGINIFGVECTVEFSALVIGLSVFTGASIAEVVRGGINSVDKGQWEAFMSLGLSNLAGIRKVIFPQALPSILPGLTSQYLNLAKNSTLAIAIGYSDIYAVSDTTITQTGRAIEGFMILLISFLILNLIINRSMDILNKLATAYMDKDKNNG